MSFETFPEYRTLSDGAEVTSHGRMSQRRLPTTGNARSLTVESRVRCEDDDRKRRRSVSAIHWMWSDARPLRHRYTSTISLKSVRSGLISQLRSLTNGVMCLFWEDRWISCTVAASKGQGHMPPGASRKDAERWWGNFLRHEIYKNFVSSVEAGMGVERQIMCVEQCTF